MENSSFDQLLAGLVAKDYDVNLKITSHLTRLYPGRALAYLCVVLQNLDEQPEVRAGAVRGLGRLKEKQAVPVLIEALSDQEAEVRKEAARFLAPMRDARSVEPLIALLSDPRPDVQLAAITPLGRHLAYPRAAEGLLHFLESANEQFRPAILTALSKSDDESVITRVIERLAERPADLCTYLVNLLNKKAFDPSLAREAVALDMLQRTNAKQALLSLLVEASGQTRLQVASILGQLGDPEAFDVLLPMLQTEDIAEYPGLIRLLGEMQDARALDVLIASLRAADARVRRSAVSMLTSYRSERVVAALTETLHDPVVEIRRLTVQALGEIGASKSVPGLLTSLQDSDASVRSLSAMVLGRLGDPLAVEGLLHFLDDAETAVRAQAGAALGELGDARAVLPLIRLLDDSDPLVIRAAALSLGQLGDPAALNVLFEVLLLATNSAPVVIWQTVQDSVIYALGLIGDVQAESALVQLLEQPGQASHTLCMAIDALGQIDDERAREPLRALLKHRNQTVRRRAEQVLAKWKDA